MGVSVMWVVTRWSCVGKTISGFGQYGRNSYHVLSKRIKLDSNISLSNTGSLRMDQNLLTKRNCRHSVKNNVANQFFLVKRATITNRHASPFCRTTFDMIGYIADYDSNVQLQTLKRNFTEDRKTKAVAIWKDLGQIKSSPLPALIFGMSGLVPFISCPGYMILSQAYMPTFAFAQVVYGATVLSFLGGIRWGITVPDESLVRPDWINLGYSVVPPLLAWISLMLPDPLSLFVVMGGLVGTAYFDTMTWGYPPWFKGLRFVLSFFAVLALWTTFICSYSLKSGESKKSMSTPGEDQE